jgi:hypothetical protein
MMPLSMETLFLILSGAILVAGVLYWLWSHIQLTQKKVQILENAVFELRGMLTSGAATGPPLSGGGGGGMVAPAPTPVAAPEPKVYSDLEDDAAEEWDAEDGDGDVRVIREVAPVSTPLETVIPDLAVEEKTVALMESVGREEEIPEDLMPGGRIQIGEEKQFKDLFTAPAATAVATSSQARTPESLESMPVKELRRLAAQRGIQGADDMKKKEILAALRRQVTVPTGGEVAVEKTLDISEVLAGGTAPVEAESETVDAEILE